MNKVGIIIPALNEERAIGLVIDEIPKENVIQIIVVDNGSVDQTARVALSKGAVVLREDVRGYGRSVLAGLRVLHPDVEFVVILDGDHSDFPEELPKLLLPLIQGQADLVIGCRTHSALPGSLTPHQRFGNWLTCFLIWLLYGTKFTDMGPFRAIRRSSLVSLNMVDKNFGWNVEMQIKALRRKLRVVEVPVRYRPRIGVSKISGSIKGSIQAGIIILWSVWKYGVKRNAD